MVGGVAGVYGKEQRIDWSLKSKKKCWWVQGEEWLFGSRPGG